MTCAVSAAVREGAQAVDLRLDRQHRRVGRRLRGPGRAARCAVIVPEGKIATGKLAQALMHGARVIALRGNFDRGAGRSCASWPPRTRSRSSTRSTSSGSRARRRPRSRSPRSSTASSTRSASRSATPATSPPTGAASRSSACGPRMLGFQAAGAAPLVHGRAGRAPRDGRERDPDRQPGPLGGGDERDDLVRRRGQGRDRRADPRRLPVPGRHRGRLLRAGVGRERRRAARPRRRRRRGRVVCVLTGHGLKDPQTALEQAGAVVPCDPELGAIERAVLG